VYRVLVGKPKGKSPLGRRRLKCVDNSRMELWEEVCIWALLGKTEGKSPLVRHRRIWVGNISMDLWGEERV